MPNLNLPTMKILKEIRTHIGNYHLDEAFDLLKQLCQENPKFETLYTTLLARKNGLNQDRARLSNEEFRIENNKLISSLLDLVEDVERKGDFTFLELERKSEEDFLQHLKIDGLKDVFLIGHTGRNLLHSFDRLLEDHDYCCKPRVHILLRNPNSETLRRFSQVISALDNVVKKLRDEGCAVTVEFYECIPFVRAILCAYENGERDSFISFYHYLPRKKSKAWDRAIRVEDSLGKRNYLVEYVMDWFQSFSGKKGIHSIVFDFDDTLADTLNVQVEAWLTAVTEAVEHDGCALEYLDPSIQHAFHDKRELFREIKRIFAEEQMADAIQKKIFSRLPAAESGKILESVKSRRSLVRTTLTREKAKLFKGAAAMLKLLQEDYQLSVVSATSESLVRHILRENGVLPCFSDIFGKHGPKEGWENVESKSEQLIQLSKKTGAPLERIVFVGDSKGDYKAARQLKMKFIEARIQASKDPDLKAFNRTSLIDYPMPESVAAKFFTSYEDEQLPELLEQYNRLWQAEKQELESSMELER